MHWDEIWTGASPKAKLLRGLLTPLSWLYAGGWQGYLAIYRLGLKKPAEPHKPVVCIGNLLAGGAGKSPVTLHMADVLQELGFSVVVSCSGYGSPASEAASVAPKGYLEASHWGDEAAMMRTLRPDLPLIVGRRRVLAAELCSRNFSRSVLLMDDGFQHLPLKKHLSILLDPPLSNRRCLPAGPYREPWGNRKRADLVLPGEFHTEVEEFGFETPSGERLDFARGEVSVLCALARPEGFLQSLRNHGLTLGQVELLPDHDPLTDGNLLARMPLGTPIAVTMKDWVKLRERRDIDKYDVIIVRHAVRIEPQDVFREWLRARMAEIA